MQKVQVRMRALEEDTKQGALKGQDSLYLRLNSVFLMVLAFGFYCI